MDKLGIVVYTDGGCRDHHLGYGCHGYLYKLEEPKKGLGLQGWSATNKGYIGKETYIYDEDGVVPPPVTILRYFDMAGCVPVLGSSNVAEAIAINKSIASILVNIAKPEELTHIEVITDSEVAIRWINEGIPSWSRANWKRSSGEDIPHANVFKELFNDITAIQQAGCTINYRWVKGHDGDLGNSRADLMASIGVMYALRLHANGSPHTIFDSYDPSGYWTSEKDRHPLIEFNRMYHYSENYEPGVYRLSEYNYGNNKKMEEYEDIKEKDKMFGARHSLTRCAIVKLDSPDAMIELVRNKQRIVSNGINHMVMTKLDVLFSKEVWPYINNHKDVVIDRRNENSFGIAFLKKKDFDITVDRSIAGLSMRAIDDVEHYEAVLDNFVAGNTNVDIYGEKVHFVDITDQFYETELNKKGEAKIALKKMFNVGYKLYDYDLDLSMTNIGLQGHINFPIILGFDLPSRNSLKRIEADNVKITLCLHKSHDTLISKLSYFCIIQTRDARAVYMNSHSNFIYLKELPNGSGS